MKVGHLMKNHNGQDVELAALYDTKQTEIEINDGDTSITLPVKGHICVPAGNSQTLYAPLVLENSPPVDEKTVILLHFDNLSNPFKDECGNVWTPTGSPKIVDGKFGKALHPINGGLQLDEGIDLLTSSFTLECRVYSTNSSGNNMVIGQFTGLGASYQEWALFKSAGNWTFYTTNKLLETSAGSLNTWQHIAVTKDENSVYRLFIDGVLCASKTHTNISSNRLPVTIGYFYIANSARFHGYIDEIRIIKSTCLYTENFTPPDKPFGNYKNPPCIEVLYKGDICCTVR